MPRRKLDHSRTLELCMRDPGCMASVGRRAQGHSMFKKLIGRKIQSFQASILTANFVRLVSRCFVCLSVFILIGHSTYPSSELAAGGNWNLRFLPAPTRRCLRGQESRFAVNSDPLPRYVRRYRTAACRLSSLEDMHSHQARPRVYTCKEPAFSIQTVGHGMKRCDYIDH